VGVYLAAIAFKPTAFTPWLGQVNYLCMSNIKRRNAAALRKIAAIELFAIGEIDACGGLHLHTLLFLICTKRFSGPRPA
jgi:hypothetical protein